VLVMSLGGAVVVRHGKGVAKLCTQGRKRGTDEEISLGLRLVCNGLQLVSHLKPPRTTNEERGTTNNHERPVCLHDTQVNPISKPSDTIQAPHSYISYLSLFHIEVSEMP
jgi:hypothetical protein